MHTHQSPFARWHGLALDDVRLDAGFWATRQQTNRQVSLEHGARMLDQAGNLTNLRLAAGAPSGAYQGPVFMDSDIYKWLEAVAYTATTGLSHTVQERADQAIRCIEAAQAPDGYLDSYYQVVAPDRKWQELNTGHELYCAGHLIQAAVAWQRCLDDDRLLRVVQRLIDHVGTIFGPEQRIGVPGHPEVELALVELYRLTHDRQYLNLAQFFVDHRGRGLLGPNPRFGGSAYYQDRVPVREASEVEGHAVRALYLTTGVTDLYLETGEQALLEAMQRQWADLVAHKLYVTGGAGARHTGEAFGHPYELPTERAYCETCAAIASIMWNWRLLLATGDGRFADLIERTLYNAFLAGVSLAGDAFFYVNPLMSRGQPEVVGRGAIQRQPWFVVACCPPNVMRLLASLGTYLASTDRQGVQLHQYASATLHASLDNARSVRLRMVTDYPWQGEIAIHIDETPADAWTLQLRIPQWADRPRVRIHAADLVDATIGSNGYLRLDRAWHAGDRVDLALPVTPRLTEPHPRIESTRGCLALERGPLVYCVEQADRAAAPVLDLRLQPDLPLTETWRADLLGGTLTIDATAKVADTTVWDASTFRPRAPRPSVARQHTPLTAIPYFAWAHRQPGAMRVWLPI